MTWFANHRYACKTLAIISFHVNGTFSRSLVIYNSMQRFSRERSAEEKQADSLLAVTQSLRESVSQPSTAQTPLLSSSSTREGDEKKKGTSSDSGKKNNKRNKSLKSDSKTSEQHTDSQNHMSSALNETDPNTSMNSSTASTADDSTVTAELFVTPCRTESPVPVPVVSIPDTVTEWRREQEVLSWSRPSDVLEGNPSVQRQQKESQKADFSIGTYHYMATVLHVVFHVVSLSSIRSGFCTRITIFCYFCSRLSCHVLSSSIVFFLLFSLQ